MPRTISNADEQRWREYLATDRRQAEHRPLTVDEIKSRSCHWTGTSVNPDNAEMQATIAEVTDRSVVLDLPGGTRHSVPFQEIIDADAVLRYWLARDQSPTSDDFRHPDPAIREAQGRGIANNSYAPVLAERVRRSGDPVADSKPVVFFNNCHNRDHVGLFGSGAFFDLGTTGRQGTQARHLYPGQPCVVAEWAPDKQIVFDWYAFNYEALLPNEHGVPDRVFFGRLFASETLPKEAAAHSERYAALFRSNGHLKIGSVFHNTIPSRLIPIGSVGERTSGESTATGVLAGAGFGDPAENKLIESVAVRAVVKSYERDGWSVRSVERDKCGFDLECSKNGKIEHVEVKGVRGTELCFIITAGEVEQARSNAKFFLVVVTAAMSTSPKLSKFSGAEFCRQFDLSAIQYRAALRS